MSDSSLRPSDPRPVQPAAPGSARAGGSAPAASISADPAGGITFRALLERLQDRADELDRKSKGVRDARELSGAVDIARASLTDALSLSDRLLEAFREAHLQSPSSPVRDGEAR
jgi:hypothetical protein